MTIASTFAADATLVLHGSLYDHKSAANLSTVGTITAGSDADGAYIEATSQPGNRIVASALNRATRASGATWVFKIKTTNTSVMCVAGEIDTGTAYMESLLVNMNTQTGDVLAGTVGVFIRSASSFQTFVRTPAININDGNDHTVAIEWTKNTDTFAISVDGTAQTLTYYTITAPTPTAGAMNYPLTLFERNVRSTTYDQSFTGKIYTFGRLLNSGFDLASLSSDASQLVEAAGTSAQITATTDDSTASFTASVSPVAQITATTADAVFSGSASSGSASAQITATTDDAVFSGTATGDTSSGTITTPALKNNTGTVLASLSGWTVNVYNPSTGALVVQKTGLSTNAFGVLTITDALIAAGTSYAYEPVHATYGRRLPIAAAA